MQYCMLAIRARHCESQYTQLEAQLRMILVKRNLVHTSSLNDGTRLYLYAVKALYRMKMNTLQIGTGNGE